MTFSTFARVVSRTFFAPLITRETVPMPTPDAAATSPIVARRDPDIPAPAARWNRFHTNEIIVAPVANPRQGPNLGHDRRGGRCPLTSDICGRYSTIFEMGISRMSLAPADLSAGISVL